MTFSSFLMLWAGCVLFTAMALILYFFIIDVTNNK